MDYDPMEELIKIKTRSYIIKGIANDIVVTLSEDVRSTFLGSTDRKGYTIKTTTEWLDERFVGLTQVEAWENPTKEDIEKLKEESRQVFALKIYNKYYLNK